MLKEIKMLKRKQQNWGKALIQMNQGSDYERKIKYLTEEIWASKQKIKDME